ncbi:hypothetical protein KMW28_15830 [Flammeovirga yaeyamensis]|uniref:Co-chaperone DjlA N-terminal domain-containing protein n=1 Tax=Flammeovirga yaeyamensis TaxID=367791 RepID=A0AAX1N4N6_9BACT|nr:MULTISPECIES: hypothetical protein [Flammeovirga]ANQ47481.1 hypothetical protein MY04_0098 [Flammeovirga sp. MY04]MBB3698522.1 hypothetical protein [Flammeovirga yaeyamensis]NMF34129.1 hypothetical protein [Flammeovirga yaeyamensis]QWG01115.1 hypothetical protein KMW28_15830 [Flammeovirga yaeyamensis]
MSANSAINQLYKEYTDANNIEITEEKFNTLLMYFPCLLIVASDGVVDDEEWVFVKYLSKFMSDAYKSDLTRSELENLQKLYFQELEYLVKTLDKWKDPFLDTLAIYLNENDIEKDDVLEILHLFADASDGVCEDEEEAIEEISDRLGLES